MPSNKLREFFEHEPIHVHVLHGGKESIFDLIMMNGALAEIRVREKHGAEPLPEHVAALQLMGLTALVETLKAKNAQLKQLMAERSTEQADYIVGELRGTIQRGAGAGH